MRITLNTFAGAAALAAMIAVALPFAYSIEGPTPYSSALSAPGDDGALPRSCKETRCSQQADGTYTCIKVNSAPWACKVGQGKTTCTEDPC